VTGLYNVLNIHSSYDGSLECSNILSPWDKSIKRPTQGSRDGSIENSCINMLLEYLIKYKTKYIIPWVRVLGAHT